MKFEIQFPNKREPHMIIHRTAIIITPDDLKKSEVEKIAKYIDYLKEIVEA